MADPKKVFKEGDKVPSMSLKQFIKIQKERREKRGNK